MIGVTVSVSIAFLSNAAGGVATVLTREANDTVTIESLAATSSISLVREANGTVTVGAA